MVLVLVSRPKKVSTTTLEISVKVFIFDLTVMDNTAKWDFSGATEHIRLPFLPPPITPMDCNALQQNLGSMHFAGVSITTTRRMY